MSDISTTSWSEVDASNSTAPPEGWPAGMFPNAVEPSARMNMAAVKRFWNRVNPTYLATYNSSSDTFTVSETQTRAGYSLYERIATRFPSANTSSSPSILSSGLGAQLIKKWSGAGALTNLLVGDIQAQEHEYYWDGSEMVLLNPVANSAAASGYTVLPSGIIIQWGKSGSVAGSGTSAAINFPIPFPNNLFSVVVSQSGTGSSGNGGTGSEGLASFVVHNFGGSAAVYFWVAVGN